MKIVYTHRLSAYEYCPARFKLEASRGVRKPFSRFEVLQLLFKQFFRGKGVNKLRPYDNKAIRHTIVKHKHILFPEGESIGAEVMVAYIVKSFEKLYYEHTLNSYFEIPDTFRIEIEDLQLRLVVDLIIGKRISKPKYEHQTQLLISFVILVQPEYWDEVSLTNRLDYSILAKYVYPKIKAGHKKGNTTRGIFEVLYFNPETSQTFSITSDKSSPNYVGTRAGDVGRLRNICKGIVEGNYIRRPVGVLCAECPRFKVCNPNNLKYINRELEELVIT